MKLRYQGKSAIITGASGGMGLDISQKLSQNNISVLMLDIKSPTDDFLKENRNCEFKKVDVTNFKSMKTHIDRFYKKNKRIDYLVNTTGVLWFNKDISAVNIDDKIWDKVFQINLNFVTSTFLNSQFLFFFKKFWLGLLRSSIKTEILFRDNLLEISKPIPPEAPVIIADFPLYLNFILLYFS